VTVLGFADEDGRAAEAPGRDRVLGHVEIALVVHGELAADPTRLLQGEELAEIVLRPERAMRVVGDGGGFGEALVVVGHELGEEGSGSRGIVQTAQSQLFDEPVL